MRLNVFAKQTLLTTGTKIVNLGLGMLISILLARGLGPEGKGIYTLAILFPTLIVTFSNLGLGPATVYYVAQDKYPLKSVFGSNTILSLLLGFVGVIAGLLLAAIFPTEIFPDVPRSTLYLALTLVPLNLFLSQVGTQILLGSRRIRDLNTATILTSFSFLVLLFLAIVSLGAGVQGAVLANVLSSALMCVLLFIWIRRLVGGISLRIARDYLRHSLDYGLKTYVGNVISFLNYRIELFILGFLMPAAALGFYSVAVGLAERLWLVSQSAAMLVFPVISAEKDERKRSEFTPIISRNVFLITLIGAIVLFFLSPWLIVLLYSQSYLPTVQLFRILLPGIVFLSASRVLANDIAGRGEPLLNTYVGGFGLVVQVILNLVLINQIGVAGSAWATSISYALILLVRVVVYSRVSGNTYANIILPQKTDLLLYQRLARESWGWVKRRIR